MTTEEDPNLSEHEQAIVRALHRAAATERAPAELRERLERQRLDRQRGGGRARSGRGLPALGARAWSGVVAIAVVAVVAAVLLIPGGTPGSPSIAAAAALAARGPTLNPPEPEPTRTYLLTARVEDLHFPNWQEQQQGWDAVGARTDRLGNRDVTTVYYRRGDQKIAYSIVSTPELPTTGVKTFMQNGRTVFTWRESGHTCVLSGVGVSWATMRNLVSRTETREASVT
jgi:hypothetical protein